MKNVDYSRMAEILVKKARQADDFTRLTALTWVRAIACCWHCIVLYFCSPIFFFQSFPSLSRYPFCCCCELRHIGVATYWPWIMSVKQIIIISVQINEFLKLGKDQLIEYYADILGAILPSIADKDPGIGKVNWVFFFIEL